MEGLHLTVDGMAAQWVTEAQVREFLILCPSPAGIDMTVIAGPTIVGNALEGWCTGYVIIVESHISVHSSGAVVCVDIFSCKSFDTKKATELVASSFELTEYRAQWIIRSHFSEVSDLQGDHRLPSSHLL